MLTQEQARKTIKELKELYGLTYTEISAITNISRSHLTAFLKERANLKKNKLDSIEKLKINYKGEMKNE